MWGFCFKEEEEVLLVGNKEEKEEEFEMKNKIQLKYTVFLFILHNTINLVIHFFH